MKRLVLLLTIQLWVSLLFAQAPEWKEFETPVKTSLRGLAPVSDAVCWASGSAGTWLKTLDGGWNWEHGVVAGLDTLDFRSIYAFDAFRAVVASAGQPAVIYRTEDGGARWTKVQEEGKEAFFDALVFIDSLRGYVLGDPVGGRWMILETRDGGKNWQSLSSLPEALPGEAAFAASSSSLLADEEGLVVATGGSVARLHRYSFATQSWEVRELTDMLQGQPSQGVFAATALPGERGYVLVGGDYLQPELRVANALLVLGEVTISNSEGPGGYRSGVAYSQEQNWLVAVGPGGSDFSSNGGHSWQPFSKTGFHAVKATLGGKVIWASGSGGRVGKLVF